MAIRLVERVAEDHLYHAARARDELEAAYRAERSAIVAIRLKLCALHIRRARSALRGLPHGAPGELDWLERSASFHEKCLTPV